MKNNNPFSAIEALTQTLSQHHKIVTEFNNDNYSRLVENLSSINSRSSAITEAIERQTKFYESLSSGIATATKIHNAMSIQWDTLADTANAFKTPEISNLERALLNNEFTALNAFVESLNKTKKIEAPNLALLRMSNAFEGVKLPKGFSAAVNQMHIGTANVLLNSRSIGYDIDSKKFYVEKMPEDTATISETNILCASMDLLSGIDEADLISFLNYLDKHLPFASGHLVGAKINEIISNLKETIDFDCDVFYHGRALPEGACPYTETTLGKAPIGVTWHGRFNFPGESHYYFSNTPKGAIREVSKHSKEKQIQIAKLKPIRKIRMLDLSIESMTQNKFLEYCRFPLDLTSNSNIKREYLLPCYVANCCKLNEIDGIKYYGSKEYSNYVSWDDTYFKVLGFEIQKK